MIDYYYGIKSVLESLDIESDIIAENDDKIRDLAKKLNASKEKNDKYIFSSKDIGFEQGMIFINGKDIDKNLDSRIISRQLGITTDEARNSDIYVFISSVKEKIRLMDVIKKNLGVNYYFLPNEDRPKDFEIGIDSRLNSINKTIATEEETTNKTEEETTNTTEKKTIKTVVDSNLYVAKLYDLVKLYDHVGDSLFDKNVRSGISKDVTGVKPSIIETLETEPEHFWFYNNGITMIVKNVSRYKKNSIKIDIGKKDDISIVNGAQTINACAEYFFQERTQYTLNEKKENVETPEYKQYLAAQKNAYVLLRVVSAEKQEDGKSLACKEIEKKVSISLNRQKPIDSEDLAYSVNLVIAINGLYEEIRSNDEYKDELEGIPFRIVRKGDNSINKQAYSLTALGQLIRASKLQAPGLAKNTYKGNMLKLAENNNKLKDESVFVDLDCDTEDYYTDLKEKFIENYGLVNLSNNLLQIWDKQKEYIDLNEAKYNDISNGGNKVIGSGNYYFIAMIVWALFSDVKDQDSVTYVSKIIPKLEGIRKANQNMKTAKAATALLNAFYDFILANDIKKDPITMEDLKSDNRYQKFFDKKTELFSFREKIRDALLKEPSENVSDEIAEESDELESAS